MRPRVDDVSGVQVAGAVAREPVLNILERISLETRAPDLGPIAFGDGRVRVDGEQEIQRPVRIVLGVQPGSSGGSSAQPR